MSVDRDGQHRALNPKELFYLQVAAEAVYQNQLAARLKALGYEIKYGKNLAIEVKGHSAEYREAESQRTAKIESEKERLGQYGPGANANIALNTRSGKLDLKPEQVRAMHLAHAEQYGNQPQQMVAAAEQHERITSSPEYRSQLADQAIEFAKVRLSERTSVMEWHEIHQMRSANGRGNLECMPHLDHGYVMTSYSAQGSTAQRVFVHLDTDAAGTSRMLTQQLIYVAASRGRDDVQGFANSREELAQALLHSEEKATALAPEEIGRYQKMAV